MVSSTSYSNPSLAGYVRYAYFFAADLVPGDLYSWSFRGDYQLGPFQFRLRNLTEARSAKFVIIGDMDLTPASVLTRGVLHGLDWSKYDGFLHAGDFSYDINDDNGMRGDNYFNSLWDILPTVPYLVINGNHEDFDLGRLFNFRWRMADFDQTMNGNFYGIRTGPAYFLFVNYDYVLKFYQDSTPTVLKYLEKRLQAARADTRVKWVFTVTHRNPYCGEYDSRPDCTVNFYYLKPFEELYRKYRVDVMLAAHEHFYERLQLLGNQFDVLPSTSTQPLGDTYRDLNTPLQVMIGCPGNYERDPTPILLGSLTRISATHVTCYTELSVTDSEVHLLPRYSANGSLIDTVTLRKSPAKPSGDGGLNPVALFLPAAFILAIVLIFCIKTWAEKQKPLPEPTTSSLQEFAVEEKERLKI